ncbi:hypothetical protein CFIMG_001789RA, partial [Ceratocystis fimbriata CBS 114723]
MQSQSHTHSPDPDGERLNRFMSNFSLDIMAETSMLEDEGYFQDSSGNTYHWKKVTDDPPSQEPPASPPRDKGKRRMDDAPGPSRRHSDRRQSSKTFQDPPSPSSPPQEDYGDMVSPNFASFRYAREPIRGGRSDQPPRDTAPEDKIPVIEIGGYPPGQPPDSMFPIPVNDSQGSFSSGDSIVRESEAPGEQLIYDSPHRALMLASKPGGEYHEGVLRVFHNEARKQIRLYIKIAVYAESQLVSEKKASIIPYYAYSSHDTNVISVYDRHDADNNAIVVPQWFIKFHKTDDLLDFQGSLTRENVELSIPSIRSLEIIRTRGSSRETFSGNLRLQLWHEPRTQRRLEGSGGSVISNGTILSGPMRDKTTPNSSKLVIFLSRTEGFFMCYITDDIVMTSDPAEPCIVKLKARQYDLRYLTRSRTGVMGNIYKRTELPAGLELLGHGINPDEQDDFTSYRSVVIEFENNTDQLQFIKRWNKLLKARREQREEIEQIR